MVKKYVVRPNRSLIVVINGPDANAGLNPNRLRMSGVTVPTKEENNTTPKSAIETTKDNRWLSKNKVVAAKTIKERKKPFNNATLNAFESRFQRPSSTKPGLTKLCTISEED